MTWLWHFLDATFTTTNSLVVSKVAHWVNTKQYYRILNKPGTPRLFACCRSPLRSNLLTCLLLSFPPFLCAPLHVNSLSPRRLIIPAVLSHHTRPYQSVSFYNLTCILSWLRGPAPMALSDWALANHSAALRAGCWLVKPCTLSNLRVEALINKWWWKKCARGFFFFLSHRFQNKSKLFNLCDLNVIKGKFVTFLTHKVSHWMCEGNDLKGVKYGFFLVRDITEKVDLSVCGRVREREREMIK